MPDLRRQHLPFLALALAGCAGSEEILQLEAEALEEAPSVVRVRWSTASPVRAQLRFGEDGDLGWETPLEDRPDTEHEALLLGMPFDGEVHFAPVSVDQEGERQHPAQRIVTGPAPNGLPTLILEQGDRSPSAFTVLPVLDEAQEDEPRAVVVLDDRGRYVWATLLDPGYQALRARLAPGGEGVIYNAVAADKDSVLEPRVVQVGWDGERRLDLAAPELHHDFALRPEGGFAYLATEAVEIGGMVFGSDLIIELDEDGQTRQAWRLFDHLEADFGLQLDPQQLDPRETLGHANGIQAIGEEAWLVSFANLGAVARIERESGELSWILGSEGDTFHASPEPLPLFRGHELVLEGDRLWYFVNDVDGDECSRLWVLDLAPEAGVAELAEEYHGDPCQYTWAMGGVNRLPGDHTLMVWSMAGRLEVLDAQLEPIWSLQADLGAFFGYSSSTDSLYE